MRVRKTAGLNQSDSSFVKVSTARFDRFGRRFSGGVHARTVVRFGEYTQLIPNMPPPARAAGDTAASVSGVAR